MGSFKYGSEDVPVMAKKTLYTVTLSHTNHISPIQDFVPGPMAPKILWPMGRVPPVEPPCGFDDEHCRLTLNPGLVSALAVLASILVIAVVFASRWVGTLDFTAIAL